MVRLLENLVTVAGALLGVALGFFLGQLSEWYKSVKISRHVKRALLNELTVIRDVISKSASTPNKPGQSGLGVPLYEFPFITNTYDSLRTEIAGSVSASNLARLQSAYRFVAKMNQPLNSEGEVNNFGYIRIIGSTDYVYMDTEAILKVNDLIKQAIDGLMGQ